MSPQVGLAVLHNVPSMSKSLDLFPKKRPQKAGLIRRGFKDSLLLQNVVAPGYLKLPFYPHFSRERL